MSKDTKLKLINTMKAVVEKKLDDRVIELMDRFYNKGEFDIRAFEYGDIALKNGFHDHYDIINEIEANVLRQTINAQNERKKNKPSLEEKALQNFLIENPGLIRPGLEYVSDEVTVRTGRLDLVLKDPKIKDYEILELKAKKYSPIKVSNQLSGYLNEFKEKTLTLVAPEDKNLYSLYLKLNNYIDEGRLKFVTFDSKRKGELFEFSNFQEFNEKRIPEEFYKDLDKTKDKKQVSKRKNKEKNPNILKVDKIKVGKNKENYNDSENKVTEKKLTEIKISNNRINSLPKTILNNQLSAYPEVYESLTKHINNINPIVLTFFTENPSLFEKHEERYLTPLTIGEFQEGVLYRHLNNHKATEILLELFKRDKDHSELISKSFDVEIETKKDINSFDKVSKSVSKILKINSQAVYEIKKLNKKADYDTETFTNNLAMINNSLFKNVVTLSDDLIKSKEILDRTLLQDSSLKSNEDWDKIKKGIESVLNNQTSHLITLYLDSKLSRFEALKEIDKNIATYYLRNNCLDVLISQTSISSKLEKELGNHRSDTESATQTIINLILEDDLKYKSILEGFTNLSESHLQKKYPNQVGKKMDFSDFPKWKFDWDLQEIKKEKLVSSFKDGYDAYPSIFSCLINSNNLKEAIIQKSMIPVEMESYANLESLIKKHDLRNDVKIKNASSKIDLAINTLENIEFDKIIDLTGFRTKEELEKTGCGDVIPDLCLLTGYILPELNEMIEENKKSFFFQGDLKNNGPSRKTINKSMKLYIELGNSAKELFEKTVKGENGLSKHMKHYGMLYNDLNFQMDSLNNSLKQIKISLEEIDTSIESAKKITFPYVNNLKKIKKIFKNDKTMINVIDADMLETTFAYELTRDYLKSKLERTEEIMKFDKNLATAYLFHNKETQNSIESVFSSQNNDPITIDLSIKAFIGYDLSSGFVDKMNSGGYKRNVFFKEFLMNLIDNDQKLYESIVNNSFVPIVKEKPKDDYETVETKVQDSVVEVVEKPKKNGIFTALTNGKINDAYTPEIIKAIEFFEEDVNLQLANSEDKDKKVDMLTSGLEHLNLCKKLNVNQKYKPDNMQIYTFLGDLNAQFISKGQIPNNQQIDQLYAKATDGIKE